MRIRHFRFLANRCRAQRSTQIRSALAVTATDGDEPDTECGAEPRSPEREPCPRSRAGTLHLLAELAPKRRDRG
jgi:hypothetical protein